MPLQCISASLSANIGQFTAPNGNDITGDSSLVTAGDATDPGYLSLNLQNSGSNSQGVHRCIIPDENGIQNYLFVGIYFGSFNGKFRHCCNDNLLQALLLLCDFISLAVQPTITSFQLVPNSASILSLNCSSSGSPAMNVIWRKDGIPLAGNSSYTSFKVLRDGLSATYDNILNVDEMLTDLPGRYSCIVHDSLGRNSQESVLEVKG